MRNPPWTEKENRAIVKTYGIMLSKQAKGESFNKAQMNRELLKELLPCRKRTSIEAKHMNISACMRDLGLEWVKGYKPSGNYQNSLKALIEEMTGVSDE